MGLSAATIRHRPTAVPRWALAVRALGAALLLLAGARAQAMEWESGVTLTSDYVFRGITQTRGKPALQFGTNLSAGNGLYLWGWITKVEYAGLPTVDEEIDYGAGWAGGLGEAWAIDVSVSRYHYPGDTGLDYVELVATLGWKERVELAFGYSDDAFATGRDGTYLELGLDQPVSDRTRVQAAVGRYWLGTALGASYSHAKLGLAWALGEHWEARVTGHATGSGARTLFGDDAGSRVEVALDVWF